MEEIIEKEFLLIEILVRTTHQVVMSKEPSFESMPIGFGAGFFIKYKHRLFFITADHNIHLHDHRQNERSGKDNYLGIFNWISDKQNFSTLITPIGGFHYMEKYDLSKSKLVPELFDVAISLINPTKPMEPFYVGNPVYSHDGELLVSSDSRKFSFAQEQIASPSCEDIYFIYGKIRPVFKGLFLHSTETLKENLKYIDSYGDYLLLNTPELINDTDDWSGLSGSPVVNQAGNCLGVICSVIKGTKSIFVKPLSRIIPMMDLALLEENQFKAENN